MKSKKAKILCLSLVATMFLQVTVFADSSAMPEPIDLQHEGEMNSQINNLMLYFMENGLSTDEQRYPDFYAGGYINDSRTSLVICVTDDSPEIINLIIEGTQNPDIIIEKVQYSLNELKAESHNILENYSEARTFTAADESLPEITCVGVNIKENGLSVGIKDYNRTYISSQTSTERSSAKTISSDMNALKTATFDNIAYYQSGYYQENASYDIGTKIASTQSEATMGHRSRVYDPETGDILKGFWTAGHASNIGSTVYIYSTGVAVGSCYDSQNSGSVDAAFIELEDQTYGIITNDLTNDYYTDAGSIDSNTYCLEFAQGAYVYMNGATSIETLPGSRGEQGGKIQVVDFSYTQPNTNKYFSDMLNAAYSSYDGDSGACVYTSDGISSGDYVIVGIHKGNDPDNAARSVITKMYNIADKWDLYAWND